MQVNKLGNTGIEVSVIGVGMEHLAEAPGNIAPVLHAAIDAGINYIDLMIWRPEVMRATGEALEGQRDKVILAGHLGVGEVNGQYRRTRDVKECKELFDEMLAWLCTDHVDVLHITYLDVENDYENVIAPGGVMELAHRLKREGKTRLIGLSGHNPKTTMRAIRDGNLDVTMHSINLATDADQMKRELMQLCVERGVGLVVMKTYAGGELLFGDPSVSPSACINYVLAQSGVSTALVGIRSVAELQAALAYFTASDEEKDYSRILGKLQSQEEGTCTYCSHCLPCPQIIDIPAVFRLLATARRYGVFSDLRDDYNMLPAKASNCIGCNVCAERCPFGVDVVAEIQEVARLFEM